MERKTVVITGSAGGISFYSAQEIARLGARVIIVGRDEARADVDVEKHQQETGNAMIERIVNFWHSQHACPRLQLMSLLRCPSQSL